MSEIDVKVNNLDKRVIKLEEKEENISKVMNENKIDLAKIVIKLGNIADDLNTITKNFREAIERSDKRRSEKEENIEKRIVNLEKNVSNLTIKFEKDKEDLEKRVDERTILKDSKNYQSYISEIIKYLLVTGIGFILAIMVNK